MRFFIAVFLVLISTPVFAQPVCAPHDVAVKHFASEYDEQSVAIGLTSSGRVIEILASPDGETFTILLTDPNKTSCVVASGTAYFAVDFTPSGESS